MHLIRLIRAAINGRYHDERVILESESVLKEGVYKPPVLLKPNGYIDYLSMNRRDFPDQFPHLGQIEYQQSRPVPVTAESRAPVRMPARSALWPIEGRRDRVVDQ